MPDPHGGEENMGWIRDIDFEFSDLRIRMAQLDRYVGKVVRELGNAPGNRDAGIMFDAIDEAKEAEIRLNSVKELLGLGLKYFTGGEDIGK